MAIANIAYEPDDRDLLLYHGALHSLVDVLEESLVKKDNFLIQQGTRALSFLCRGNPRPDYERVADAIPVLGHVIQEVADAEVLQDALWALSYHSDEEEEVARLLETDKIVPSLIGCLEYNEQYELR